MDKLERLVWPAIVLTGCFIISTAIIAASAMHRAPPVVRYSFLLSQGGPGLPTGVYRCDTITGEISRWYRNTETRQGKMESLVAARSDED
jgi:hypothetical protein